MKQNLNKPKPFNTHINLFSSVLRDTLHFTFTISSFFILFTFVVVCCFFFTYLNKFKFMYNSLYVEEYFLGCFFFIQKIPGFSFNKREKKDTDTFMPQKKKKNYRYKTIAM